MDLKTAWNRVAKPAWEATPPGVKNLFQAVVEQASELCPPNALAPLPWPPGLVMRFADQPSGILAGSALAMSRYVLWNPDRAWLDKVQAAPTNFVRYCDQVLRVRCDLREGQRSADERTGLGLWVHEGMVRVEADLSSKGGWVVYIGLASEQTWSVIKGAPWPERPIEPAHPLDVRRWLEKTRELALKLARARRVKGGALAPFFDGGFIPGHEPLPDGESNGPERGAGKSEEEVGVQRKLFA